jgi:pimeloyl-ACP methyl ester carboxylesterase
MLAVDPWHASDVPLTENADGTTLHWHEWGSGPCVLVAGIAYGYPAMVRGLVADLAADHRVLLPDLRGTGRSSRHGPYDLKPTSRLLRHCSPGA